MTRISKSMEDTKLVPIKQGAIMDTTLEQIWLNEREPVHLGYCRCGRLNVKGKYFGRFDDWAIECPGCHKINNVAALTFKTQPRT